VWNYCNWLRMGPVVCCEHGNEPSGSIKMQLVTQLTNILATEPKGSTLLTSNPTAGHNPELI
jgi:hypothetical protein